MLVIRNMKKYIMSPGSFQMEIFKSRSRFLTWILKLGKKLQDVGPERSSCHQ